MLRLTVALWPQHTPGVIIIKRGAFLSARILLSTFSV